MLLNKLKLTARFPRVLDRVLHTLNLPNAADNRLFI